MKMLSNLDLCKNEIQNVRVQNLATAPSAPVIGQVYYNTTDKTAYVYDGTSWRDMAEIVDLSTKQDTLVSGTNIKTINNTSLLGSGDISISGGGSYTAGTGISIEDGVISSTSGYLDATTSIYKVSVPKNSTLTSVKALLTPVLSLLVSDINKHYNSDDGFVPILVVAMDSLNPWVMDPKEDILSRVIGIYTISSWVGNAPISGTLTLTNITPGVCVGSSNLATYSEVVVYDKPYLNITVTEGDNGEGSVSDVAIEGTETSTTIARYLDTDTSYTDTYTPKSDGSPATKKYVDDSVSASVSKSSVGTAGGVASLDETGKVPSSQLPSYVDDVVEGYYYNGQFYTDSAHTDLITPETGKIYVDLKSNNTYRWSGSAYVEISQSTIHKYTYDIGITEDNFTGERSFNHGLKSRDVIVAVYNDVGQQIMVDVKTQGINVVTIGFVNAPKDVYKVVVIA